MKKCYADNPENTKELLVGEVEDLDDVTPLQLAVDGKLNAFLYAEPTKRLLTKIWTKDIKFYSKDTHFLVRYLLVSSLETSECKTETIGYKRSIVC